VLGIIGVDFMVKLCLLSSERYGDQQLRRRACPEFVADRAMILMLLEVILFYKLTFTSKERFHAG